MTLDAMEMASVAKEAVDLSDATAVSIVVDSYDDIADLGFAVAKACSCKDGRTLVLCPDGTSLERLGRIAEMRDSAIEAVTVRDFAFSHIDPELARARQGRPVQVLDALDETVLFEDMKVTGAKPSRLREILKFFYRSISESKLGDESWIATAEEAVIYRRLMKNLAVREAILECEIAPCALASFEGRSFEFSYDLVVCLDFGTWGRGYQDCALALPAKKIMLTCSEELRSLAHPCPDHGRAMQLADEGEGLVWSDVRKGDRILPKTTYARLRNPDAEMSFIAKGISESLSEGVSPKDVCAVVPKVQSALALRSALASLGISSRLAFDDERLPDLRAIDQCADVEQSLRQRLSRDSGDMLALRMWVGIGDWLMASDAFASFMEWAEKGGMGPQEAYDALRQSEDPDSEFFGGRKIALRLEKLSARLADPQERIDGLSAASQESGDRQGLSEDEDAVRILLYSNCHGEKAERAWVACLVDGVIPEKRALDFEVPADRRKKLMDRGRVLFSDLMVVARDSLVLTSFAEEGFEEAERAGIDVKRIFMKQGKRMARVGESAFVTERLGRN